MSETSVLPPADKYATLALPPMENESAEAYEAFLCFFEMDKPSIKRVAQELGASENTVYEWSAKYQWRQRVRDYRARLVGSRLRTEATLAEKQTVAKAQHELDRFQLFALLGRQLLQSAEKLFQHQLLSKPDKIDMDQILKIMQLGQKMMSLASDANDLPQGVDAVALQQGLQEAGEWVYAQRKAAALANAASEFNSGEGI